MTHKVLLMEVVRQAEPKLVKAINELKRGHISNETYMLLNCTQTNSLNSPVHLYGENAMVYEHNMADWKHWQTYHTLSLWWLGTREKNNNYTCPKSLLLCEGARIIVTANISKHLVNGTRGYTSKLDTDGPTITNGMSIKLDKYLFSKYSVKKKQEIATRQQFPIILAFPVTVNRVQGLTLAQVVVHYANITFPGHIGVSLVRWNH